MLDPMLTVIMGNVRRAGPQGCTIGWLARRVNTNTLAIERALALQIQAGIVTEVNGVYKIRQALP